MMQIPRKVQREDSLIGLKVDVKAVAYEKDDRAVSSCPKCAGGPQEAQVHSTPLSNAKERERKLIQKYTHAYIHIIP